MSGTFATIDWGTGTYFIKTETDPTGGTSYTISGTSQLLSVPYALLAAEASTVPDKSITLSNLDDQGASAGDALTFNGSSLAWGPVGDITGVEAGDGLFGGAASGNALLNIGGGPGIAVAADAISLDETYTNGLYVNEGQTNSITNPMIQSLAVTNTNISGSGASSGQVLSYNGSNVVWATPSGGSVWSLNGSDAYYNSGNVGIGTSTPSDGLTLVDPGNGGDIYIDNSYPFVTVNSSTGTGNAGLAFSNSGVYSGWLFHSGTNDGIYISAANTSNALPQIFIANDGNVGIGTDSPTYPLEVAGGSVRIGNLGIEDMGNVNLGLDGDVIPRAGDIGGFDLGNNVADEHWDQVVANSYVTFSDSRVKNSVESLNAGLKELMQLRPVKFKYNHNIDKDDQLRYGLIAQEVEAVMPILVINEDMDLDPKTGKMVRTPGEFKTLNYMDLIPVLVKAIQEQQERIQELESALENLRIPVIPTESFEDSNPR